MGQSVRPDYQDSPDGSRLIDAQADLQTALGFYRLKHGDGDPIEQRLRAGMDGIHDVLKDHGVVMGRYLSAALKELGIDV